MLKYLLLFQLLFLFEISLGQKTKSINDNIFVCGYDEKHSGQEICEYLQNQFASNEQAKRVVRRILDPLGLPLNFVLVSCPKINNAVALTANDGLRYIIYDNEFMESIDRSTSNWSSISILAHEVGHHFAGHTLKRSESLEEQRSRELEADKFSGFILHKLGASLEEAQAALRSITRDDDDTYSTHPKRSRRMKAIEDGFNNSKLQLRMSDTDKTPNIEALYNEAYTLATEIKDYKRAIERYTDVLALNPKFQKAYNDRGYCRFLVEDYIGALLDYSNGLEIGYDLTLLNNRSNLYLKQAKFEKAILDAETIIQNPKDCAKGYFQKGYILEVQSKLDSAIKNYNIALELDPSNRQLYINRGNAKYDLEDYEGSLKDYNIIINQFPSKTNSDNYGKRGTIFHMLKQYSSAISDYSSAIQLGQITSGVFFNRGLSYSILREYSKAINDFNQAIEYSPNDTKFFLERGSAYFSLANYTNALSDYNRAIELDKENFRAFSNRGVIFHLRKDYKNALLDYNMAISINPQNDNTYKNIGVINENLENYNLALENYNKALEINPKNADALNGIGNTYNKKGMKRRACENWEKACNLDQSQACDSFSILCK